MKKPAFTIIEVLIVITIIGILVAFLVLDFNRARRVQELDIMVQQTLALMDQSRAQVDSGKATDIGSEDEHYLCLGGYFELGGIPQLVQMDFDSDLNNCDFDSHEESIYGIIQGAAVLDTMEIDQSQQAIWAMFVPPEADLVFFDDSGANFTGDGVMTIVHASDDELGHTLLFSSTTNRVSLEEKNEE